MPNIRDSFWRGREFTSIEHMQADAVTWPREVAGRRQCRPLGGAAPMAVFGALEADALLPLPPTPFVLGPLVHRGGRPGHPHQGRPHSLLGALETDRLQVDVRSTATMVQVYQRRCRGGGLPPRTEATVRLRDAPGTADEIHDDQVHSEVEGSI